jgi:DNA-binding transcriptional LysR family regulator
MSQRPNFDRLRSGVYAVVMNLNALLDFRLVATHGGFGKASRASGKPKATLSKRVIELEESLGVRLFDREGRSLRLTEEGRKLAEQADHILLEIELIEEEVRAGVERPRGLLRVAAPTLFSHLWAGRITGKYIQLYPDVTIDLVLFDGPDYPADTPFDVLIRINPPPTTDLVGRLLVRDSVRFIGPQSLVKKIVEEGLTDVPALATTGVAIPKIWKLIFEGREFSVSPKPVLRLPSRIMVRDAVREGLGIAELPKSIVASDVRNGRLIDLGQGTPAEVEVWALHASRRLVSRKISTFTDFLCDFFRNTDVES